ncbi:MAG: SGNH/GDSL hydrolase family protein [Hydrococcus sp. RM1_1_31]|nr:SGNH/GDSL hydrolase family protein [Hydrococcus sp. RM1_1_31]
MTYKLPIAVTGLAIALGTLGQIPVEASTLNFDRMIVFGDSLSDTKNFYNLTGLLTGEPFPSRPFYSNRRFSNGKVWVEDLAKDLGLKNKVTNYAIGGSTSGSENLGLPGFPAGLKQQIDLYQLSTIGRSADPDDLYILWSGSNDLFGGMEELQSGSITPESLIQNTLNNVSNSLTVLANKRANNVLVPNLADLGGTPLGQNSAPQMLSFLTQSYNARLAGKLEELSQRFPETNFISFDVNSLFNEVATAPERFGLTNTTEACTNTNLYVPNFSPDMLDPSKLTICDRPNKYLFWDSVHPTKAAHRIIADAAWDVLKSELGYLEAASEKGQLELLSASTVQLPTTASAISQASLTVSEPNAASSLMTFGVLGGLAIWRFRNRLQQ